jgi:hypothetical protein
MENSFAEEAFAECRLAAADGAEEHSNIVGSSKVEVDIANGGYGPVPTKCGIVDNYTLSMVGSVENL